MRSGTPSSSTGAIRSRDGAWRDSRTSRATQCGVTPSATSDATFSNATMDISHAVTQVLVMPRGLARPKGLILRILVGGGVSFKF
jgi:hypothetical protein